MNTHLTDAQIIDALFQLEYSRDVELHMTRCPECRARADAIKIRLGQLDLIRGEATAPESLIQNTIRGIRVDDTVRPSHWGRTIWLFAGAAAAVLAVSLLTPILFRSGDRSMTVAQAPTPPPAEKPAPVTDKLVVARVFKPEPKAGAAPKPTAVASRRVSAATSPSAPSVNAARPAPVATPRDRGFVAKAEADVAASRVVAPAAMIAADMAPAPAPAMVEAPGAEPPKPVVQRHEALLGASVARGGGAAPERPLIVPIPAVPGSWTYGDVRLTAVRLENGGLRVVCSNLTAHAVAFARADAAGKRIELAPHGVTNLDTVTFSRP